MSLRGRTALQRDFLESPGIGELLFAFQTVCWECLITWQGGLRYSESPMLATWRGRVGRMCQNKRWLRSCTWQRALHGITTCVCAAPGRATQLDYTKTPRAKNLELHPSENKCPVSLLEDYVATVRGTQGSRTRSKLSLCAGTGRCPFMSHTHSMRFPPCFNDALLFLVTVSGMCNSCAQG